MCLRVADEFLALAAERNVESAPESIRAQLEEYKAGVFRLVVVGEIKKGKSSFINALLGEPELLPVDTDVSTSTVYKVAYGDTKQYTVFFNPPANNRQADPPPPKGISETEVSDYGTENGNPGNEKEVEYISVQLPNPLLKSGVIIIDTPGLGGLFAGHADVTWRNAPSADAVCFVLDSVEAVVSRPEMESLKKFLEVPEKLYGTSPPLFFVQTKIDAVAEEQREEYQARNLEIISESLSVPQLDINYFLVSSLLKADADAEEDLDYLEDSGFPRLLEFFHGSLQEEKEKRLAQKLLGLISSVTQTILRPSIESEREIFTEQRKEKLDELVSEIKAVDSNFNKWSRETYPQVVKTFTDKSADLKLSTQNQLSSQLDYGRNSPIVKPIIQRLRMEKLSARELTERTDEFHVKCIETCEGVVIKILKEHQKQFVALTTEILEKLSSSLENTTKGLPSISDIAPVDGEISIASPSRFEELRSVGYGAVFGGIIVTVLTGGAKTGLLASIFGPLAIPIGVVTGCFAWRDFKKRAVETTLSQIETQLLDVVRRTRDSGLHQFTDLAMKNERSVRELLETAQKDMSEEIKRKRSAVETARRQTREENSQKTEELKTKETEVKNLENTVEQMLGA